MAGVVRDLAMLGAAGLMGTIAFEAGPQVLHWADVLTWDVRRCEILGRGPVPYDPSPLPWLFPNPDYTNRFEVRVLDTGRVHSGVLDSPDPTTSRYPKELGVGTFAPYSRHDCRVDPDSDRAYLDAEPAAMVIFAGFMTLVAAGAAVLLPVGVVADRLGYGRAEGPGP